MNQKALPILQDLHEGAKSRLRKTAGRLRKKGIYVGDIDEKEVSINVVRDQLYTLFPNTIKERDQPQLLFTIMTSNTKEAPMLFSVVGQTNNNGFSGPIELLDQKANKMMNLSYRQDVGTEPTGGGVQAYYIITSRHTKVDENGDTFVTYDGKKGNNVGWVVCVRFNKYNYPIESYSLNFP